MKLKIVKSFLTILIFISILYCFFNIHKSKGQIHLGSETILFTDKEIEDGEIIEMSIQSKWYWINNYEKIYSSGNTELEKHGCAKIECWYIKFPYNININNNYLKQVYILSINHISSCME